MLAEIYSGALTGIEAYAVSFELNAGHGRPDGGGGIARCGGKGDTIGFGRRCCIQGFRRSIWHRRIDERRALVSICRLRWVFWRQRMHYGSRDWIGFAWQRLRFNQCQMPSRLMASVCRMEPEAEGLLRAAMHDLHLSARAYDRILKVARTVADLAEAEWIGSVVGISVVGSSFFVGIKKGVMGLTSSVNLGCIGAFSANGILSRGSSPWKYRTVRGEHSVSLSRRSGQ